VSATRQLDFQELSPFFDLFGLAWEPNAEDPAKPNEGGVRLD